MSNNIIVPQQGIIAPEIRPYGVFRVLMYDISGVDPESYGPGRRPKNARLVLDETRHNQVVQVGLNGYAKIANGESGFSGVVNYCALGTGANDPTIGDTQLQAEVGRTAQVVGENVRINNSVAQQFYFGPTEANGSIKEIGGFVDGTALANSGTLFDRALFDIVKTNLNAVFIYFTLTFSA